MKKYKVLFILPALNVCGGMESFIMNYYRNMDKSKFEFNFIVHQVNDNSYYNEILSSGGKVHIFPPFSLQSLQIIKKKYISLLVENKFDIVHCNMANAAFIYLKIAQKLDIPVRILHSHQNKAADTIVHSLRNIPLIAIGKRYANCNIACSEDAGNYLFGRNKYMIIPNCIDYSKFKFDKLIRKEVRNRLDFNGKFIIGHSGRLCAQKNQSFIIDLFYKFHSDFSDSLLLLIGEGEDKKILQEKVSSLNLDDSVIFLGSRSDVNHLLQAVDLFIFPSKYEGLGISVLEAQASGLYCLCSTGVPEEAKISPLFERIDLNENLDIWNSRLKIDSQLIIDRDTVTLNQKYDIKENSDLLKKFYINKVEEHRNDS